ncbi:MAG: ketopantoate reductase family protein [Pseudomonadota bacterium]|nr:ketopantoate reductase family protein [Burkholderiales bacterium]MDQ3196124.1 ketopantoate reductase family protein [Pseudomonadota bacterium]
MRILILGAGGIGGYFGARFCSAGADVTFLVRPPRAEQLNAHGLRVISPLGDAHIAAPKVVAAESLRDKFDVIVLSCKAYDFASAVDAIAPAVGGDSVVLPLLNGVAHLDALDARFGRQQIWGGVAHLALTLTPSGEIKHLNDFHRLIVGSRSQGVSAWLSPFENLLASLSADFRVSGNVEQDMWDKFVFLTALAGATCTMRGSVADIQAAAGGYDFITGLLQECEQVAIASHRAPDPEQLAAYRAQLTDKASALTASMLRDIEAGKRTEADHILGDMLVRGLANNVPAPLLLIAYSHLQVYERRRRGLQ